MTDILRGELERMFELDELMLLSTDLLGLDPQTVGGTDGKGSFARALVERCREADALPALADAMALSKGQSLRPEVTDALDGAGDDVPSGTDIGGFTVTEKLGEDGTGTIYKAQANGTSAAVKVAFPTRARNRSAAARWQTVVRAQRKIESPYLPEVLQVGTLDDGRPWIARTFVEGTTVADRIHRGGPIHYNELRSVVRGVLTALESLHGRGLVHGDVRPESVVIIDVGADEKMANEPNGVLLDAGADRLLAGAPRDPSPRAWSNVAPELIRGGPASPRADLYAVGCLIYEALTGAPPFEGSAGVDVAASHLAAEAPAPSERAPRGWVTQGVDAAVLKCLAKEPSERFQSAAELRAALESLGRASIPPDARPQAELDMDAFNKAAQAVRGKPGNEQLAAALEKVVEPAQAWQHAVAVFQEAVDAVKSPEEKKSLLFRIARIQEGDLGDHEGAEASYREILEIDENDAIARSFLEEVKRSSGDAEGLVDLLLEKVEGEEDSAERAAILREVAEAYERRLNDPENAFIAWVQALAEMPRHERSISEVERLAGADMNRWNEALGTLTESVEHAEDDLTRAQIYVLMGRWYADRVARPDYALPSYGQALAIEPSNEAALAGTVDLYRKAQSWEELVTVLVQRADTEPNPVRARDHRAEAAEIVHRKLNDSGRAVGLYEEVLRSDPAHERASEAVESIYREKQSWTDLVTLLETKAKAQRGPARVGTLNAIAELQEDHLDDLDQAAAFYEAAHDADAADLGALKGLERIYARRGKFAELIDNLQKQLAVAATPRQRIALHERIGNIQLEEFVDHEKAADEFAQVVAIDPGHEAANTTLASIYRSLERYDELAVTLERHATASADEDRAVGLLLRAAKVLTNDVGAPERAMAAADRALALQPGNGEALEMVARVRAQVGDTQKALEATEKLVDAESDTSKRAELLLRAGQILEDGGDRDGAIERYKRALDTEPTNTKAAAQLRSIYAARGDAIGAVELLSREIDMAEGDLAKAGLLARLGELAATRLEDPERAEKAFTEALRLDPTCTPAARGLGDSAFAEGNFAAAVAHYEPLLARASELEPKVARDVSVRCGDAFRKLNQPDKAERAYLNARAFAPDDREVLARVADLTFESGSPDEAVETYREYFERYESELVGAEKGRVLYRIGEAQRRADQDEAEDTLRRAAELLPQSPDPLRSLRKLYESQERWKAVVAILEKTAEQTGDESEGFQALVEAGDFAASKLDDQPRATRNFLRALEMRGDDRNLLTKLMGVYSEGKNWDRLVEVLMRIADLVEDPAQLARYFNTAGSVTQYELKDLPKATQLYERAIQADPTLDRAFDEVVELRTSQGDAAGIESAFRTRLGALGDRSPETRATLWQRLGDMLSEQGRGDDAMEAYREAHAADPSDRERAEKLTAYYADQPTKYFEQATSVHRDLLGANPYRVDSYKALRKLYTETKRADEAWCVCQALTVLKNASPDEESYFQSHRKRTSALNVPPMSEDQWASLRHPDQDPVVTAIFSTIAPAVRSELGLDPEDAGVLPSARLADSATSPALAPSIRDAAQALGLRAPVLYKRSGDPGALSMVLTDPASIGLGQGAEAGGPEPALAFVAARQVSFLQAGHDLRMFVTRPGGLRAWLLAAVRTQVARFPVPADLEEAVEDNVDALNEFLSTQQREGLDPLVTRLLNRASEIDMRRWVSGVDLTADRVAFVLSNDLEIAHALIKASPAEASATPQQERLRELTLFSVSPAYFTLRRDLGLSLKT